MLLLRRCYDKLALEDQQIQECSGERVWPQVSWLCAMADTLYLAPAGCMDTSTLESHAV